MTERLPRPADARVFRDKDRYLWVDLGDDELVALDSGLISRIRDKYPVLTRAEAEQEFGVLQELPGSNAAVLEMAAHLVALHMHPSKLGRVPDHREAEWADATAQQLRIFAGWDREQHEEGNTDAADAT